MTSQADYRQTYTPFVLQYSKADILHEWEEADVGSPPLYIDLQEGDVKMQLDQILQTKDIPSD
jgi:hypothetical protein